MLFVDLQRRHPEDEVFCTSFRYYNISVYERITTDIIIGIGIKQVLGLWVADTIHQGLVCHTVYKYLITEYGHPLFLFSVSA